MPLKVHSDDVPTLNLTPMIDVLFLLIIFFLGGTQFVEMERKVALKVPQLSDVSQLPAAPERRVINVYRDGQVSLDHEFLTLDELSTRLAEAHGKNPGLGVIIRGDAEGTFQNVATVLGAVKQAGVSELGISVRMARQEP